MSKTKFYFLLLLGVFISFNSSAQIDIKFQIGPQISNYWNSLENNEQNDIPLLGFSADARLAFFTDNKFQFETGLGINQKGWFVGKKNISESFTETYGVIKYKGYSYHFELPLQANLFFKEPNQGLYVLGSMRPSFKLSSNTKTYFENQPVRIDDSSLTSDQNFNLLARVGIGYEIPLSKTSLTISSYFEHELIDNSKILKEFDSYFYSAGLLLGIRI